jgi:hypothetical protein
MVSMFLHDPGYRGVRQHLYTPPGLLWLVSRYSR